MAAIKFDIEIEQGTSVSLTFPVLLTEGEDPEPRDLTGLVGLMQARRDYRNPRTIIEASTSSGRLTLDEEGQVTLSLDPAVTTAIHFKTDEDATIEGVYDLELEDAEGNIERSFEGTFTIKREVTRTTPLEVSPAPSTDLARNLVFASPNLTSGLPTYRHLQNADFEWIDQLELHSADPIFILINPNTDPTYTESVTFTRGGNQVGSISTSPTTTAFNTLSDYRRKTNLEPITGGLARVLSLPVYRFNWVDNPTGPKVDGFIAHEVAEVVPEAITGEKDAVRPNGQPSYQGIDQAKLTPLLTAAVQELHALVQAGDGDKYEVFTQGTPASTWSISHGLNKHPAVTITDSAGDQVLGDVHYINDTSITVTFSAAFSGTAYLN